MSSPPKTSDPNSFSPSAEEDVPPYPWGFEGSDFERALENRWDAQERQWNAHLKGEQSNVPNPAERELVSPFIYTSDEDSSEEENEDPTFLLTSTPERSQPRSIKRDPSPPTSQTAHQSTSSPLPRPPYRSPQHCTSS